MPASPKVLVLLSLVAGGAQGLAVRESAGIRVNPIRRVVTMMQDMSKKIVAEGRRDQELFDAYMCYCKNGVGELKASIEAAETKIPQVESGLEEATATKEQVEADLVQHKKDRADAKAAVAEATELREKEAAAFAKFSSDANANLAAMGKAIAAISKGMKGAFLQTSAANVLRQASVDIEMSSADRDMLSAFLAEDQVEGYAPQSGQIVGILKQMKDTMDADLKEAVQQENDAKATFKALVTAKTKEINANTKAIEAKTKRNGDLGVQITELKEDLDDTQTALAEDKKFLADLDKGCGTREAEYEVVKKTRTEELLALADTIKILNDDDALDLFKKTLPTPSLLQTMVTSKAVRQQALHLLRSLRAGSKGEGDARISFIALALHGKKVDFGKVIKMVDDMVKLLLKEQDDDDAKKEYCESSLDRAEDELKVLEQTISDLEKATEKANGLMETLTNEIKALVQGIKDLDKQVADATANRKKENTEYEQTMADDKAAKELLALAKNRLNKFYNPKLYKAAFTQDAPAPPPEAVGAYQKKGQESSGVLTMIDMLVADLDKEIQEMTVEEKDAQAEYEDFIKDSADKRAVDSKSVAEKEDVKADTEGELQRMAEEHKETLKQAMAKDLTIRDLHVECDWLLSNYGTRKEARAGEVESLKNAKAVLSGADYS